MKIAILATSLLAFFSTSAVHLAHAEEYEKFSLETGMHYNSGKYGGTQSTNILYVPVIGKYQNKLWTLKLTVPYLRISGPRSVINGIGVTGTTSNTVTTRSGLGDTILGATYSAYNGGSSGLIANVTGKIKIGTANSSQGLGTGKNDFSLQADLYQATGNLTSFGGIGYKVYGAPVGYKLNNVFFGSLGGSYKFDQETNGGVMLNFKEKSTPTGSSHIEAILFASHKLEKNWKLQGYVLKGFTNAVPDIGIGASVGFLL